MTGWELEKPGELLQTSRNRLNKTLNGFLKRYPLATVSADHNILLIIRKYHPSLNCSPDNETYQTDDFRYCMAYYTINAYTYFELPTYDYQYVSMQYDAAIGDFTIRISAKGITRITNIKELSQQLNNFIERDEATKRTIFESLANKVPIVTKPSPITQTEIQSAVVGRLTNTEYDDWWTAIDEVDIPFFNNEKMPVSFTDFNPNEDHSFIEEADELLRNFLAQDNSHRLTVSAYVYQNCMDFLDAIGYDDADDAMWKMKQPEEVWQFVKCTGLYVSREPYEDKGVYLQLLCDCDWEQEHGLQLVYNKQGKLVRVSAQDGHVIG